MVPFQEGNEVGGRGGGVNETFNKKNNIIKHLVSCLRLVQRFNYV